MRLTGRPAPTERRVLVDRYMQVGFFVSRPDQAAASAWRRFRCVSARPAKFGFPVKML
jgi:hypothetical protein